MFKQIKFFVAMAVSVCFVFEQTGFAQVVSQPGMPAGYVDFVVKDKFRPLHLRSLSFDQSGKDFNMVLDKGDDKKLSQDQLKEKTENLLAYFKIGLTLPNTLFWVNLRPDSDKEVIDPLLEKTDVGRILLEADLQLKKDVANFTNPETPLGRQYWEKVYAKAEALFGSDDLTIPTLTRPWIVPGEIIVREGQGSAYIYKATLRVMLEQDYIKDSKLFNFSDERLRVLNEYSSQLIRTMIIPKLTKEVNSSKKYASLRQVYYSLVLAQWFKHKAAGGTAMQSDFSAMIDSKDLSQLSSKSSWSKSSYYQAYKKSFEQGEYAKEETVYTASGPTIRQYVSGGIVVGADPGSAASVFKGSQKDGGLSDNEIAGKVVNEQIDFGNHDGGSIKENEKQTPIKDLYRAADAAAKKDDESKKGLGARLLDGAKNVLSAVKSKISRSDVSAEASDQTPQGVFARLKSLPRTQLLNLGVTAIFIGIAVFSGAWIGSIALTLIITAYSTYRSSQGKSLSGKENAVFWAARVLILTAIVGSGAGLPIALGIAAGMSGFMLFSNWLISRDSKIAQAFGYSFIILSIVFAAALGVSHTDAVPGADTQAPADAPAPAASDSAAPAADQGSSGAVVNSSQVLNVEVTDSQGNTVILNNDVVDGVHTGEAQTDIDTNGDGVVNFETRAEMEEAFKQPLKGDDGAFVSTQVEGQTVYYHESGDTPGLDAKDTDISVGDKVITAQDINVDIDNNGLDRGDLNIKDNVNTDSLSSLAIDQSTRNIDTDNDGVAGLNIDMNFDGQLTEDADLNLLTDKDMIPDKNVNFNFDGELGEGDGDQKIFTVEKVADAVDAATGSSWYSHPYAFTGAIGGVLAGGLAGLLGMKSNKRIAATLGITGTIAVVALASGLTVTALVFILVAMLSAWTVKGREDKPTAQVTSDNKDEIGNPLVDKSTKSAEKEFSQKIESAQKKIKSLEEDRRAFEEINDVETNFLSAEESKSVEDRLEAIDNEIKSIREAMNADKQALNDLKVKAAEEKNEAFSSENGDFKEVVNQSQALKVGDVIEHDGKAKRVVGKQNTGAFGIKYDLQEVGDAAAEIEKDVSLKESKISKWVPAEKSQEGKEDNKKAEVQPNQEKNGQSPAKENAQETRSLRSKAWGWVKTGLVLAAAASVLVIGSVFSVGLGLIGAAAVLAYYWRSSIKGFVSNNKKATVVAVVAGGIALAATGGSIGAGLGMFGLTLLIAQKVLPSKSNEVEKISTKERVGDEGKSINSRIKESLKKFLGLDKDVSQRGRLGKLATLVLQLFQKKAGTAKNTVVEKAKENVVDPLAQKQGEVKKLAQEQAAAAQKRMEDAQKKAEDAQKWAKEYKENKIDPALKQAKDEMNKQVAPVKEQVNELKEKTGEFKQEIINKKKEIMDAVRGVPAEQKEKITSSIANAFDGMIADLEKRVGDIEQGTNQDQDEDGNSRDGGTQQLFKDFAVYLEGLANGEKLMFLYAGPNAQEQDHWLSFDEASGYSAPMLYDVVESFCHTKSLEALPTELTATINAVAVEHNLQELPLKDLLGPLAKALNEEASAIGEGEAKKKDPVGGIDFRALPILTQPGIAGMPPIDARAWQIALEQSKSIDTAKEWSRIQATLKKRQLLDCAQLKQYVIACSRHDNADKEMEKVLVCVAQMLRVEEDEVLPTGKDLQELLVILDSDKPVEMVNKIIQEVTHS